MVFGQSYRPNCQAFYIFEVTRVTYIKTIHFHLISIHGLGLSKRIKYWQNVIKLEIPCRIWYEILTRGTKGATRQKHELGYKES
jgi:hypothetical protein